MAADTTRATEEFGLRNDLFSNNAENVDNDRFSGNDIASDNRTGTANEIASGNDILSGNRSGVDNTRGSGNDIASGNTAASGNVAGSDNTADIAVDLFSGNETDSNNDVDSGNRFDSNNTESLELDVDLSETLTETEARTTGAEDLVEAAGAASVTADDIAVSVDALTGAGNDQRTTAETANAAEDGDTVSGIEASFGGASGRGDRDDRDDKDDKDDKDERGQDRGGEGFSQTVTATAEQARVDDGMDDGVGAVQGLSDEGVSAMLSDVAGDAGIATTNAATADAGAAAEGVRQSVSTGGSTVLNEAGFDVTGGDESVTVAGDRIREAGTETARGDTDTASTAIGNDNDLLSGNESGARNDLASDNDVLSGNVTASDNTVASDNAVASDNVRDAGNTELSDNAVASDNLVGSNNVTDSGNAVSADAAIASGNVTGSGNDLGSDNALGSNNVETTEIAFDGSLEVSGESVFESGAADLIDATDGATVLLDDVAIDYGSLSGEGNDMAFDLDQANTLADNDSVSGVSLDLQGGFSQSVSASAGEAVAGDGVDDGFGLGMIGGGEGQASLLSDVFGDASVSTANIAEASATATAQGVTQSIATGGNVLANSIDQSVVGGDSAISQMGDDIVA